MTDLDLDATRSEWKDEPHDPTASPAEDVICAVLALCDEVERLRVEIESWRREAQYQADEVTRLRAENATLRADQYGGEV